MAAHLLRSGLVPAFTLTAALVAPAVAWADSPPTEEEGGGVLFYGEGMFANIRNQTLSIAWGSTEPDPLRDRELKLDGGGTIFGGGLRVLIIKSFMHGGIGLGMFGVQGLSLRHKKLAPDLTASLDSTLGVNCEVYAGKELLDGPIYPYLDLRVVLSVLSADVQLRHPTYGVLGATRYNGYSVGIGPRAGVVVPLGSTFFVDLSGYFGLIGAERGGVFAGFGLWDR